MTAPTSFVAFAGRANRRPVGQTHPNRRRLDVVAMASLYAAGWSWKRIADCFSTTPQLVRDRLAEVGVARRRLRKEASA